MFTDVGDLVHGGLRNGLFMVLPDSMDMSFLTDEINSAGSLKLTANHGDVFISWMYEKRSVIQVYLHAGSANYSSTNTQ
ncbi:hypothetical protein GJ496_001049 [Pomphorhynchus laevis]|nr:hypothetical protein GJ496_001049 [Pomphorhynchus laevis]